jgi:ABC-type nitrate/sulfonate/bicarbonate transport system substrate-binding protein
MKKSVLRGVSGSVFLIAMMVTLMSCSDRELIPLQVGLTRSVSKLPFIIALDQGLYEKYGLDLEVRLRDPEFEGAIELPSTNLMARSWRRIRRLTGNEILWDPKIEVAGANGRISGITMHSKARHLISIAATDCGVRTHIVAKKGVERLEDLMGLRIGVSHTTSNSGFVALLLAERMGWDPVQDISILSSGNNIESLRSGRVDAFVADERSYALAIQEGFPILLATSSWGEALAGNSVNVEPEWLENPSNREVMRRFLKATIEGIAIFHQNRELALDVMARWHGITDRALAEVVYEEGLQIPRKPYPCYEGITNAMKVYDSNEMRKYSLQDFYDDELIKELDESGFIDSFYEPATPSTP